MRIRTAVGAGVLAALWVLAGALQAVAQEWPPVTEDEKALKECPQQPGAPAVFLYREKTTNDDKDTIAYYCRLKILTPAGKERANIEIPVLAGHTKLADLKARVVHPDGTSVEFKGQVFDKTALRAGRIKVTVKSFALPDVDVGSIIDYRYKIVPDTDTGSSERGQEALETLVGNPGKPREGGIDTEAGVFFYPVDIWDVQADLFTRKAKFGYLPSEVIERWLAARSAKGMTLSWVTHWIVGAKPAKKKDRIELELENIPAFEREEFMPPESSQRMEVRLFYLEGTVGSSDQYWKKESQNWQKGLEKFMSKTGTAAAEAQKAVAGISDPVDKIRALYGRAQEIKNLSYDRSLTSRKRRELKIKDNGNVADVLKNNYGLRSDITRTFAAMARAAGFEAQVVRVATREDKIFDGNLCGLYNQFDSELALVQVSGVGRLFDPATPYCPLGLVRWGCTATVGLAPTDEPPSFIQMPPNPPDLATTVREIALRLDADGNLAGTAKVAFAGQEALNRRLEHINDDDVEIRKDLEAELTEILPSGAKVELQKLENIKNNADKVLAQFDISMPGVATQAGERMLFPVSPLIGFKQHPFRHPQRKYPVWFSYPYRVFDDVVITLPAGRKVETTPLPRSDRGDWFDYSLACTIENGTALHVQRNLTIKKCSFRPDQYGIVRSFFDHVRAGDEEQVVLSTAKK